MNDLEERLRRTLRTAARQLPPAPPELTAPRRRFRFVYPLAAAATAAATVTAAVLFAPGTPGGDGTITARPPSATAGPSRSPEVEYPPPLAEVWPDAVREIPNRLPNGKKFHALLFLDDGKLLVNTEASFEKADMLASYDLATGETRELVRVPTLPKTTMYASHFTTGEGRILWVTARRDGGRHIAEIWSAPVTGGQATVLGTVDDDSRGESGSIYNLTVADGAAYWSKGGDGGLWRLPLDGGAPQRVPGTDGYHLYAYPWLGRPDEYAAGGEPAFGELLNFRTGERRQSGIDVREPEKVEVEDSNGQKRVVSRQDERSSWWSCGLTRCVGQQNEPEEAAVLQLRGNPERQVIPHLSVMGPPAIALDRFVLLELKSDLASGSRMMGQVMVDLETGKTADLGLRPAEDGTFSSTAFQGGDTDMYAYGLNGKIVIVNLKAIR
ncbi:hypothetical protein [Acrocarpospora catenulata]|uniref:hypothetical protein n=1 Tax=Acrocarpospora catenulata TaxID=2836182 RepID=UPI001BDABD24|nr:hypothetical protein [Acrocarpospora catenulata]